MLGNITIKGMWLSLSPNNTTQQDHYPPSAKLATNLFSFWALAGLFLPSAIPSSYRFQPHQKHLVLKVLGLQRMASKSIIGSQGLFRRIAPGLAIVHSAKATGWSLYAAMAVPQDTCPISNSAMSLFFQGFS